MAPFASAIPSTWWVYVCQESGAIAKVDTPTVKLGSATQARIMDSEDFLYIMQQAFRTWTYTDIHGHTRTPQ